MFFTYAIVYGNSDTIIKRLHTQQNIIEHAVSIFK